MHLFGASHFTRFFEELHVAEPNLKNGIWPQLKANLSGKDRATRCLEQIYVIQWHDAHGNLEISIERVM